MSNKLRILIISAIVLISFLIGSIAVGAFVKPSEREQNFIRYGELRQAQNQLHAENEADRIRIETRGKRWDDINKEVIKLEQKLF